MSQVGQAERKERTVSSETEREERTVASQKRRKEVTDCEGKEGGKGYEKLRLEGSS